MKPIINLEEKIGKTVGKRTAPKDAFAYGMALQKTGADLGKAIGHKGVPRVCTDSSRTKRPTHG